MKKKIESFEDVQLLVRSFYAKVLNDERLGPFFSYVRNNHWDKHLQVLDSFGITCFFIPEVIMAIR
ncbi:MAG: hypothetical protein WKG06_01820 [Segetibacter sp.]